MLFAPLVALAMDDSYPERFLDEVTSQVRQLVDRPVDHVIHELRPIVQRTLLTREPDGSWPEAHLLQEALRAYVDLIETSVSEQPTGLDTLTQDDRRWLDACCQCTDSLELFEDVLTDLRADIPAVPSEPARTVLWRGLQS